MSNSDYLSILKRQLVEAFSILANSKKEDGDSVRSAEIAIYEIAKEEVGASLLSASMLDKLVKKLEDEDLIFAFKAIVKTPHGIALLKQRVVVKKLINFVIHGEDLVKQNHAWALKGIAEDPSAVNLFSREDVKILKLRAALDKSFDVRTAVSNVLLELIKHPEAQSLFAKDDDIFFEALESGSDAIAEVLEIISKQKRKSPGKRNSMQPKNE